MPNGFYKDVCSAISAKGFAYLKNAKGSHEIWKSAKTGKTVLVPRNIKSRHTANGILKDAGCEVRF